MGKLSALKEGLEKAVKHLDDYAKTAGKIASETLDYKIDHVPIGDNSSARLHDLTSGSAAFDENIYGKSALQFYGSGDQRENEVVGILKRLRGNPDAEVTIYRGVPSDASDINPGDWVTLSKRYAQDYAEQEGGKVLSKKVKASDVTAWADSLLENGYFPAQPKAFDMSQAARMQRAAEQGFDYVRATAGDSPIAGMPWTMYKKADGDIDTVAQRLSHTYGENVWLAKADDAVDAKEIQRDIIKALRKHNIHEDYGVTAASLAREATPDDIVDSAGLWDNPDLVQIVWDEVLEPKGIMAVKTPDGLIRFDEAPARSINAAFDHAQKESSNLLAQFAPAAVGTGLAALGLNPQETYAAINNYMQATQGSNPILENLNRNLQQFGMNERGQMQTGTMQATPHPVLGQVADVVRIPQAPGLGPLFGGAADYLDKLAQGQNVTYGDRLGAALDIIP